MKKIHSRLAELSERIDDDKKEQATLEGQNKEILKTLKNTLGTSSIEEAEKILSRKEKEQEELREQIEEKLKEVERKYSCLNS